MSQGATGKILLRIRNKLAHNNYLFKKMGMSLNTNFM